MHHSLGNSGNLSVNHGDLVLRLHKETHSSVNWSRGQVVNLFLAAQRSALYFKLPRDKTQPLATHPYLAEAYEATVWGQSLVRCV